MTHKKPLNTKELPTGTAVSETEGTKRNRVRHACKPGLQWLFDIVNLIPPDQEMECPYVGLNLTRQGSQEWIEKEKQKYETFKKYLESFPKAIQAYIFNSTSNEKDRLLRELDELTQPMSEAEEAAFWTRVIGIQSKEIHVYERIRAIRKDLYRLTEIGENLENYLEQQLDIALDVLLVEYAHLDKDGRLRRQPNPYVELMVGVEISRIRACLICRKLFWAQRKDKKCCSEEHSAIVRQRQSRLNKEKNADLYAKSAKLRRQKKKSKRSVNGIERYKQKGE